MTRRKTGRSGVSKKRSKSNGSQANKPLSPFLRLAAALLLAALFVGVLYKLAKVDAPSPSESHKSQSTAQESTKHRVDQEYTFYSLLKNFKIDVPKSNNQSSPTSETSKVSYLIQAGSFKTKAQASQQRAELILLELAPIIEKTTNSHGDTWYRVILGPYTSRSEMAHARTTLISNRFEAMVMKRKE